MATELFDKRKDFLEVPLTKDELIERADLVVKARRTMTLLCIEFDSTKKKHKEAVTAQEHIVNENLVKLDRKAETREVDVELHADWGNDLMYYYRKDNGEVYKTRPISEDERQTKIFRDEDTERKKHAKEAAEEIHKEVFGTKDAAGRKKKKDKTGGIQPPEVSEPQGEALLKKLNGEFVDGEPTAEQPADDPFDGPNGK